MILKNEVGQSVVYETDSLEEALTLDPESEVIDLVVIKNCKRQREWKNIANQFIPESLVERVQSTGAILVRIGLGYLYLLDISTGTGVKVCETDFSLILQRYLTSWGGVSKKIKDQEFLLVFFWKPFWSRVYIFSLI